MKSLKNKLFGKEKFEEIANLEQINGGVVGNKSDVNYTDSKDSHGHYDIAVMSMIDTVDSKQSLDKPSK